MKTYRSPKTFKSSIDLRKISGFRKKTFGSSMDRKRPSGLPWSMDQRRPSIRLGTEEDLRYSMDRRRLAGLLWTEENLQNFCGPKKTIMYSMDLWILWASMDRSIPTGVLWPG